MMPEDINPGADWPTDPTPPAEQPSQRPPDPDPTGDRVWPPVDHHH